MPVSRYCAELSLPRQYTQAVHEDPLLSELRIVGGAGAPSTATAQLRRLLVAALQHSQKELSLNRSGYGRAVTVVFSQKDGYLLAGTPAPATLHTDPQVVAERGWLVVAATVGALVSLAEPRDRPRSSADLELKVGVHDSGYLLLAFPVKQLDLDSLDELVPLAFAEQIVGIDRLRAQAGAVPEAVIATDLATLRQPIGATNPLLIAEALARLGGMPADQQSGEDLEDVVLALFRTEGTASFTPHKDPDPAKRVARRILQRLNGMGKWGGYHTNFTHLARGFAGNDRALALAAGEALIQAGLLAEKNSVGQRHVFLNPRRVADIRRMIESGEQPLDLQLP